MEKESEQIHTNGVADKISFFKEQFSQLTFRNWDLVFKRPAKTSRNTLLKHRVCYVFLHDAKGSVMAKGEIAPIIGLSLESWDDIEKTIQDWNRGDFHDAANWPSSVKAAIDMLWQDLFSTTIPTRQKINGLVWMNEIDAMFQEAINKFKAGFQCIKLKVGALNFDDELILIQKLRSEFGSDITLRLDANGAWTPQEALSKLDALSHWNIHSIEQPIAARKWKEMQHLCKNSPIPIALDEELIGVSGNAMNQLLSEIAPQYLVLKPSLHGGLDGAAQWIHCAQQYNINWWATSALESNIGLSHIYRWVSGYQNPIPQGLGTGHLYINNWQSPMELNGEWMSWNDKLSWMEPWS
jgi:o-succinylbenzoate synthase